MSKVLSNFISQRFLARFWPCRLMPNDFLGKLIVRANYKPRNRHIMIVMLIIRATNHSIRKAREYIKIRFASFGLSRAWIERRRIAIFIHWSKRSIILKTWIVVLSAVLWLTIFAICLANLYLNCFLCLSSHRKINRSRIFCASKLFR